MTYKIRFTRMLAMLLAGASPTFGALAMSDTADGPAYILDGQYTASLDQSAHRWRLLPLRGDEVDVTDHSRDCGSHRPIPSGLWFVTQDDHGHPSLLAPSVTALPTGFPQQLALRACGEQPVGDMPGDEVALFVPAVILGWINSNVGSVLIND